MTNLVDIMKYIISRYEYTLDVKNVDGSTIYVCKTTKHLSTGSIITDADGLKYKVVSIDVNNYIEVEPALGNTTPFSGVVVNLPEIYFGHGTPQSVNNEYIDIDVSTSKKTPLVWLYENTESDIVSADSSLEGRFDVRLFFLAWANTPKWNNDQHNDLAVKPMEELRNELIRIINSDYSFNKINRGRSKPRSRFGVYITNNGNRELITDEDLTGVEFRFDLEALDLSGCKCN